MNSGRSAVVAAVVLIIFSIGVWRAGPSRHLAPVRELKVVPEPSTVVVKSSSSTPPTYEAYRTRPQADPLVGFVGEGLNAESGSVRRDLEIVSELLDAWQTNFPGRGNPVGENHEITEVLSGKNKLKLELIPADHPAVNSDGELCDRWGTPLMFHQISGYHMEVRSAGEDRRMYTDDDVIGNPAPDSN